MEMQMTLDLIQSFLNYLAENGYSETTRRTYRQRLMLLYDYLPGSKLIQENTLEEWKGALLKTELSPRTINLSLSAAGCFLRYCGLPSFQARHIPTPEKAAMPEITRQEYLRLLSAARLRGNHRSYLLVKVFGSTGIMLRDLHLLTVEGVSAGVFRTPEGIVHIPECLRLELADYAQQRHIWSGPLFVTGNGIPLDRSNVAGHIQRLGEYAQVPPEKATPSCLRKLYLTTMDGILDALFPLAERSHEHLLEQEQRVYGWAGN